MTQQLLLNISEQLPLVLSRTRIAKTQVEQQVNIDETYNQQLIQQLNSAAGQYFSANRTALVGVIEAAAERFSLDPVGTWLSLGQERLDALNQAKKDFLAGAREASFNQKLQVEKLNQRSAAQFEFAATMAGEDEAYIKKFHEQVEHAVLCEVRADCI